MRTPFKLVSSLLPFLALALSCGSADTAARTSAEADEPAAVEAHADASLEKDETAVGTATAPGEAAAKIAEPPKDDRPRIGALGPHTWIYKRAAREGLAIGKMRIGTSVVLKSTQPIDGPGCKGKWYAIEPRGYVCDDNTATLDLEDPWYKALAYGAPKQGHWPYRYAHANGTPMYGRVPTPEEWQKAERDYGPVNTWKPLGAWAKGHEENIVDEPIKATDEVPYFLKDGKRTAPGGNYNINALVWKKMPAGSMLAYTKAFEMHGRVWLLTPDTMVVPADRVSHMKQSTFQGIHFDKSEMRLPFAWNRSKAPLPKYKRGADGKLAATNDTLAPKSPIEITGQELKEDGMVYFELRKEPGTYVGKNADPSKALDIDLVLTRAATELPKGIDKDEKWLEAKILSGTLTAYVGMDPVMTTLFSPGKGGAPLPTYKFPDDHSKYATTALGNFPLEWKERVATMSNEKGEPKVLWFTDVPHQQYLRAPLAMHVAYWHEDFGKRKSAECLNVSPLDGLWLFGWTLPVLPEGWNAVGAGGGNGESTVVFVGT
ncbi:MAG: L,D-transpeptidase [Polyangiaceae bacterium]|nr:L,D-transpeptidase [Polyangiaceae bacterium]